MYIKHVNVIKTFCLFFVIMMHAVLPFAGPSYFWKLHASQIDQTAVALSSLFNFTLIPSFLFVSGFLLNMSLGNKNLSFSDTVIKRAKRLLVPWFFTIIFWLVPLYTFFDIPSFNRPLHATLLETYKAGLLGLFTDHLWFLLVLFWVTIFWLIFLPAIKKFGEITGFFLAVAAATIMQIYGSSIIWYCIWETTSPIIFFYMGYIAFKYRSTIDSFLLRYRIWVLMVLMVFIMILYPHTSSHFSLSWLLSLTGCILIYTVSLIFSNNFYSFLIKNPLYRYFEANSFRYYLFHLPPGLLSFIWLDSITTLPPVPFMALSFSITLLVTTFVVSASRILENLWSIVRGGSV